MFYCYVIINQRKHQIYEYSFESFEKANERRKQLEKIFEEVFIIKVSVFLYGVETLYFPEEFDNRCEVIVTSKLQKDEADYQLIQQRYIYADYEEASDRVDFLFEELEEFEYDEIKIMIYSNGRLSTIETYTYNNVKKVFKC